MLDDKYRIERLLATGGMGAVYLGTHIKLRKRVAIKVLNPQLCSAPMVERFHREAITASQIGHEGIAQVTDLDTSSEGEPFLVMEYLEGESLARRLRSSGPLMVADACELGCAILSPLSAAHHAGIVHRDLKPDNVFLVRQAHGEMVKLLDFGISRATGLDSEFRLTNTGLVLGTPYYMSPEQARGESQITPAADLYAFGVMLYEILVGDVPIRAENYNQLMYRVTIGDYARPRERRPDLPEELERIILHAMAQAPEDRPASAIDLEQALLAFCRPVFRDHANGRISTPRLLFQTSLLNNGIRGSIASIDHTMFAGATLSDTRPGDVSMSPGDTEQVPAAAPDDEYGEPGEHASQPAFSVSQPAFPVSQPAFSVSQPAFPVFEAPGDDPRLTWSAAPRGSLPPRIVIGIGIFAVAATLAGGLVLALAGRGSTSATVAPTMTPTATATATPAPAATPPAGQMAPPAPVNAGSADVATDTPAAHKTTTIMLRLAVQPSGASILLDGERVKSTELVVPQDTAAHRLQITAPGYAGYDETISFDESQRLVVQLKQTAGPVRSKDRPQTGPELTDRIESTSPYK